MPIWPHMRISPSDNPFPCGGRGACGADGRRRRPNPWAWLLEGRAAAPLPPRALRNLPGGSPTPLVPLRTAARPLRPPARCVAPPTARPGSRAGLPRQGIQGLRVSAQGRPRQRTGVCYWTCRYSSVAFQRHLCSRNSENLVEIRCFCCFRNK